MTQHAKHIRDTIKYVAKSRIATYYSYPQMKPGKLYSRVRFTFKLSLDWQQHFQSIHDLINALRENLPKTADIRFATLHNEQTVSISVIKCNISKK